jgi:hypothetical protein
METFRALVELLKNRLWASDFAAAAVGSAWNLVLCSGSGISNTTPLLDSCGTSLCAAQSFPVLFQ